MVPAPNHTPTLVFRLCPQCPQQLVFIYFIKVWDLKRAEKAPCNISLSQVIHISILQQVSSHIPLLPHFFSSIETCWLSSCLFLKEAVEKVICSRVSKTDESIITKACHVDITHADYDVSNFDMLKTSTRITQQSLLYTFSIIH